MHRSYAQAYEARLRGHWSTPGAPRRIIPDRVDQPLDRRPPVPYDTTTASTCFRSTCFRSTCFKSIRVCARAAKRVVGAAVGGRARSHGGDDR